MRRDDSSVAAHQIGNIAARSDGVGEIVIGRIASTGD
jgi:hypothetical protein